MIDLVKRYYKAWETKNKGLLINILHPELYGVRIYDETSFFTVEELVSHFDKIEYAIKDIEVVEEDLLYRITLEDNQKLLLKITFKDNKIFKVYEQLEQNKKRIKCTLSYDGSSYFGYQKQPNEITIQETIEKALKQITKEDITIHSSGRTDKGVHALNQVIHFDTESNIEPSRFHMVLNSYLPDSIHIKDSKLVPETFHSRYDVKAKEYMYKINTNKYNPIQRNYEWFISDFKLDIFKRELKKIEGKHDFTSFTKTNDKISNVREIYETKIITEKDHVLIHIKGNGFLRYMVRNIIGALYLKSIGKIKMSITEIIEAKDPNIIKEKAPAGGLYLYDVTY